MLTVTALHEDDLDAVITLAREVWQATYPALISQAQIDAMLAERYAPACLRAQLADPAHGWWVARHTGRPVGFAHCHAAGTVAKLDKLYVAPAWQRQGIGRALFDAVGERARATPARTLRLQVNRGNTAAIAVYRRWGFSVVEAKVFDIGHGFVMDDYVMEIAL